MDLLHVDSGDRFRDPRGGDAQGTQRISVTLSAFTLHRVAAPFSFQKTFGALRRLLQQRASGDAPEGAGRGVADYRGIQRDSPFRGDARLGAADQVQDLSQHDLDLSLPQGARG